MARQAAAAAAAVPAKRRRGSSHRPATIAPAAAPTVFQAYTRALAGPASAASPAASRTAKGKVAPRPRATGRRVAMQSQAPPHVSPRTTLPESRSVKGPTPRKAAEEQAATKASAATKPRRACAGVRAKRAATAEPSPMPQRKAASMVAKAYRLPPRTWVTRRVHSTSRVKAAPPDRHMSGRIAERPRSAGAATATASSRGADHESRAAMRKTVALPPTATHSDRYKPRLGRRANAETSAPAAAPSVLAA